MDYLLYLLLFAAGFYIGFKVNEKIMEWTFISMMQQAGFTDQHLEKFIRHWAPKMGRDADAELDQHKATVSITIEQHGEMLYAYRKDDQGFLAQGTNREELLKTIADKFKDVKFTVTAEDGAEFIKERA
jgi:hypothetical protein